MILKAIKGFEDYYKVSNTGQILNVKTGNYRKLSGRNNGGYVTIDLYKNGKCKYYMVHQLVACAFIKNPNNYKSINHINGIKTDNRVENLEWTTHQKNLLHSRRVLKKGVGSKHGMSKLVEEDIIKIRELYDSRVKGIDIAKQFNVTPTMICLIGKRKNWKCV